MSEELIKALKPILQPMIAEEIKATLKKFPRDGAKEELLTVRELAKEIKRSVSTVYRLVEEKQIPCYRIGGAPMFKLSEVLAATKDAPVKKVA